MERNSNLNTDKFERKEWEIPTIEILNFKQTQGGSPGTPAEDTYNTCPSC